MIYLILLDAELLKIFISHGGVPHADAEMIGTRSLNSCSLRVALLLAFPAIVLSLPRLLA